MPFSLEAGSDRMRAVLCRAWGTVEDLTIADVPEPKPAAGEVLIAVKATAVNCADALPRTSPTA